LEARARPAPPFFFERGMELEEQTEDDKLRGEIRGFLMNLITVVKEQGERIAVLEAESLRQADLLRQLGGIMGEHQRILQIMARDCGSNGIFN